MKQYTENAIAKFEDMIRESDPPVAFQVAVDDGTKFMPLRVIVKLPLPATT